MEYVFYADVFFLTNCYLDVLSAYAVGEILEQKKRKMRYLAGGALSGFFGCFLFLKLPDYDMYLFCMHFIVHPIVVWFLFCPTKKEIYVKAFCLMYFMQLLFGGSIQWLYGTVTGGRYYELCLLLTVIPWAAFLYILRRKRQKVRCFYEVWLFYGENKLCLRALMDTGNRLKDPYTKKEVHIIGENSMRALCGGDLTYFRMIPFSSLGKQNGLLRAFTVDKICVYTSDKETEEENAVLGVAKDEIFRGRPYQMILNSGFEKSEGKKCI